MIRSVVALCLAALSWAGAATACPGREAACGVDEGEYYALLPPAEVRGAILFLHGYRSSAMSILNDAPLIEDVARRGYVLLVPNGSDEEGRDGGSWSFSEIVAAQRVRDDDAFLKTVADDAAVRFGLDRGRMILGGFSEGGFMTSYLACREPTAFSSFTPVAGGFWRPAPETCAGPVRLFHTHGWRDEVVPLEGRWLRRPDFAQADIFAGLDTFRTASACTDFKPVHMEAEGAFLRRGWTCAPGSSLEFALFDGGHRIPPGWADMMLDWYEALP